jgi:homoserine kinase
MALTIYIEVGTVDAASGEQRIPVGGLAADEHHPATRAFRAAGGEGALWTRGSIPMGRGLGYSGAARVAGVVLAHAERHGLDPERLDAARPDLLALAAAHEGHADNAAASLYGGVVATAGGQTVRVPLAINPAVVVWIPGTTTSTDVSRASLPSTVSFDDAAFNVGRVALLVAGLASGSVEAVRTGTQDRLHQDVRFARAPRSREAVEAALDAGAWGGWLSGSGPTVAALVAHDRVDDVLAALPVEGHAKVVHIDPDGALLDDVRL